jgi:hypothetical protein
MAMARVCMLVDACKASIRSANLRAPYSITKSDISFT